MAEIQFKESNWYRVYIEEKNIEKIKKMLLKGNINYIDDVIYAGLGEYGDTVSDTSEQLTVQDNDGCETITLHDDSGDEVACNADNHVRSRIELFKHIAMLEGVIDTAIELLTKENMTSNRSIAKRTNSTSNYRKMELNYGTSNSKYM